MKPALYDYRPPIDLTNARLRKLAAALGPAYVRVSGTWANSTYFPDKDEAPAEPPAGFAAHLRPRNYISRLMGAFSMRPSARLARSPHPASMTIGRRSRSSGTIRPKPNRADSTSNRKGNSWWQLARNRIE
jgi:hypothetical protein